MPEATAITPLKTLLKFPFQGPNWRNNFIIGAALTFAASIVPIVPMIFVYGYFLQIMRRAIEGQDLELPAWDDWGTLAVDGLRLMLVGLIYLLPAILVLLGGFILYLASIFWPLLASAAERGGEGLIAPLLPISVFGSLVIMMLSTLLVSWSPVTPYDPKGLLKCYLTSYRMSYRGIDVEELHHDRFNFHL